MARVVKNEIFTAVYATTPDGNDVRLASLRSEFHRADYAPATTPPRLVELEETGKRKAGKAQTIACFMELGDEAGRSRLYKVPVVEKASDIVKALREAGFSAPPVKTPVATQVWRMIGNTLSPTQK